MDPSLQTDRFTVFSRLLRILLQRVFHLRNCLAAGRQFHILSSSSWLKLRLHVIQLLQKDLLGCSAFTQHRKAARVEGEKGMITVPGISLNDRWKMSLLDGFTHYSSFSGKALWLCAGDCWHETHGFQALKKHRSLRALLSHAGDEPEELARPFYTCDRTQDTPVFACDCSVENSTPGSFFGQIFLIAYTSAGPNTVNTLWIFTNAAKSRVGPLVNLYMFHAYVI